MNNNSANGQNTSRGLLRVSEASPCLHCGKPDWCYSIGELTACKRPQYPPAAGWEVTSKTDKDGTPFYAPIREKKAIRPRQTRYWEYPARDGSPLVRVVRFDDGKGGKSGKGEADWHQERWGKCKPSRQIGWVVGTKDIPREDIPIYRYAEVRKAIANNELIFIAEGEDNVDRLWALGFAATCNIGGSGKWRESDTRDLEGAKVVIIPDRDEPGINHAELLHQQFSEALWLYPFPNSKAWENLPKSKGLDIADWIEHHKITADDIKAAIGDKKVFKAPAPEAAANVIRPPQFQVPPASELGEEIDQLLESDLRKSQINLKISELAQKFRISSADVLKIYREREQEQEQEADRPDVATEIESLLSAHKSSIALTDVLPVGLAQPIEKLATMLNLRAECYLAALLTQVSSLFKVGTETVLRRDTDWRCVPNYFAGMVAEVSQLKTPVPKAIIDRPMRALREKAQKEFEQAEVNYETELNNWKAAKKEDDRGPAPKPPRQRIYSFDKTTGEGIIYQQAEFPDQAMMYFCDELAGVFKSGNQYRGGKGSDEEDMLSFWNGTGTTVLRALGVRASVEAVGLSIFGTIQPDVLAGLLKDCSDSNGKFARFDFVFQPLAVPNLPEEDGGRFDLTPMLADLYQKIDALPAIFFEFDREAKEYHRTFTLACHRRRIAEPKQGLRGALGKMPEKVGKLATTIHALTCVFNGQQVTNHIPRSAVEAAVKFVKFAADQVASLYTEFSDRTALAPNLTKILLAAERKSGTISVRDAQKNLFRSSQRPSTQTVREWFSELEQMGYGEVTTVKNSVVFNLSPSSPVPQCPPAALNPDVERIQPSPSNLKQCPPVPPVNNATGGHWGNTGGTHVPQLETLSSMDLKATGGHGGHNLPLSKKSESLLLSYLTEPEEFAEQIRKAIANFDRSLALEIEEALKGKAKAKLRNEVKDALAPSETNNFKLLAKSGFLRGTRVKYVGDPKYAEQYEGLELEVDSIDEYFLVTCRKPDGSFTTRMKPEELEKL
jgi:5S rRNA maturation endonuclease (ribonuclease M5)